MFLKAALIHLELNHIVYSSASCSVSERSCRVRISVLVCLFRLSKSSFKGCVSVSRKRNKIGCGEKLGI